MDNAVLFAFGLTLLAGLSTGIGSALAFFTDRTNTKLLSVALGFSAGVMLYVSFLELFPIAQETLEVSHGKTSGAFIATAAFFGGVLLTALIDRLVPSYENPHEAHRLEARETKRGERHYKRLRRVGLFTALALAIHNFPEGIATFVAALQDPTFGVALAVAVAIHNIPEGIAVSVPLYYATGSRKQAFWYSFCSGLAEPVGAALAAALFLPFFSDTLAAILFAGVAGIMVFIALDELLPAAREYGEAHRAIYGVIAGMLVMAVSLLLIG